MNSRTQAIEYPAGELELYFCTECGFIFNARWDRQLLNYNETYEETQHFSDTFHRFAKDLAKRWIDKFEIQNETIVEIGCGKAEFLSLMCRLGNNAGIGIDPSVKSARLSASDRANIRLIPEYFSANHTQLIERVVCCRHTLEHVDQPHALMKSIRQSLQSGMDALLLFELPDTTRVLDELAFWDTYYEHCSYFTAGSLAHLFRATGFNLMELERVYDQQYLILAARPSTDTADQKPFEIEVDLKRITDAVDRFSANIDTLLERLRRRLNDWNHSGEKVAIWGAGSKCVAFCTTLQLDQQIEYAVDINPHKQGKFLPGTGQIVLGPSQLRENLPDKIIVMNPIYMKEIAESLEQMNVRTQLVSVNDLVLQR